MVLTTSSSVARPLWSRVISRAITAWRSRQGGAMPSGCPARPSRRSWPFRLHPADAAGDMQQGMLLGPRSQQPVQIK
jgi:hypothetical protein